MSLQSQHELGSTAKSLLERLLACLGVNHLNEPRRDPRAKLSATHADRRIPIWDLDDY